MQNYGSRLYIFSACRETVSGKDGSFFAGKTIAELEQMCISDLAEFLEACEGKTNPLLNEIKIKLSCMMSVGLKHLALSRPVPTLSGRKEFRRKERYRPVNAVGNAVSVHIEFNSVKGYRLIRGFVHLFYLISHFFPG